MENKKEPTECVNLFLKLLFLILICLLIGVIYIGLQALIFWGIGYFICWAFGIGFTWTFWHGLVIAFIITILKDIFSDFTDKGSKL
ncbi:MAG: hypothetical protein ACLR6T_08620 [Intestinibacter sp.]